MGSTSAADRTISNSKLDIIVWYEKGVCTLIDVAMSGDRNVIKKGAEKILIYKDLTTGHSICGM